jgi:hypothetical protein
LAIDPDFLDLESVTGTGGSMPTIPTTIPGIHAALEEVEREVAEFFGALPPGVFVARLGEGWSPAEHLLHLNTAVRVVALVFSIPRWLLRLLSVGRTGPRAGTRRCATTTGPCWRRAGGRAASTFRDREPSRAATRSWSGGRG